MDATEAFYELEEQLDRLGVACGRGYAQTMVFGGGQCGGFHSPRAETERIEAIQVENFNLRKEAHRLRARLNMELSVNKKLSEIEEQNAVLIAQRNSAWAQVEAYRKRLIATPAGKTSVEMLEAHLFVIKKILCSKQCFPRWKIVKYAGGAEVVNDMVSMGYLFEQLVDMEEWVFLTPLAILTYEKTLQVKEIS